MTGLPDWGVTSRPGWDAYFLGVATAVAARADCTRRHIGAVLVGPDHRVVSTGYNGAPSGVPGCATAGACPRGQRTSAEVEPGSSYDTGPGACIAVHAEANALLHGDATRYRDGTAYVTDEPCDGCYRLLWGGEIDRVVWPTGYRVRPWPRSERAIPF